MEESSLDKEIDVFASQVFSAILGSQQVQAAWLGGKLGWYQALVKNGPLTTTELADATKSSERYAREWCEHQTGWTTCQDASSSNRSAAQTLILWQ